MNLSTLKWHGSLPLPVFVLAREENSMLHKLNCQVEVRYCLSRGSLLHTSTPAQLLTAQTSCKPAATYVGMRTKEAWLVRVGYESESCVTQPNRHMWLLPRYARGVLGYIALRL